MTTPAVYDRLIQDIKERLAEAKVEAAESHKAAMNSYGAGYDAGRVATLRELLISITGDDDDG